MRDSALKRCSCERVSFVVLVGEELMRDSALKQVAPYPAMNRSAWSEKSSCATAL